MVVAVVALGIVSFTRFKADTVIVSESTAETVARAWLASNPAPMIKDSHGTRWQIKSVHTFENSQHNILAYIFDLSPRGYVVISANEAIEPVIAFSAESNFIFKPGDSRSILPQMLARDIPARISRASTESSQSKRMTSTQWSALRAGSRSQTAPVPTVTPVVAPMLTTTWDQSGYYPTDPPSYNYYTPNHYLTGCCATALSQLLYYYKYPSHASYSGQIQVDGVSKQVSFDDSFDYSIMPKKLDTTTPLNQTQAVAKLVYDVGVTLNIAYTKDFSSCTDPDILNALTGPLGYNQGVYIKSADDSDAPQLVQDELKSGHPVVTAIYQASNPDNGHEIVVDGLGTDGASNFYHLNLGWSGDSDGWYSVQKLNVPDGNNANYDSFASYVLNVRAPTGTDTTPPVVTITSPEDKGTISGTTTIMATASDDIGVTKVDFYTYSTLISSATASPYTATLDTTKLSNGDTTIEAKAYDAAGNVTSSTINVTVKNTASDLPVISIAPSFQTYAQRPVSLAPTVSNGKTFTWSELSGPGTVVFSASSAQNTSVTVGTVGKYTLRLSVTGSTGKSASQDISLSVNKIADINGDDSIDYLDMALLLYNWVPTVSNPLADLNNDGHVDQSDFDTLIAQWGK